MKLTPARLAAIYDCLRVMPPFNRWRLPPSSEIRFSAPARHDIYAEHVNGAVNMIRVSSKNNGHLDTIIKSLAHEMVHESQLIAGQQRAHGADFKRRARLVARQFGWDEKAF